MDSENHQSSWIRSQTAEVRNEIWVNVHWMQPVNFPVVFLESFLKLGPVTSYT